jgi:hypothetical protein
MSYHSEPKTAQQIHEIFQQHIAARAREADCMYDQSHEYSLSNVLGPSKNTSRRRVNYTTIFCAICLAVWLVAAIAEHVR